MIVNDYMMDNKKLIELENLFIRLYGQGKRYKEVARELNIGNEIVLQWQNDLEAANKLYADDDSLGKAVVTRKDDDGNYLYRQSVQLKLDSVEMLKFSLWQLSSRASDMDTLSLGEQELVKTAVNCSPAVEQHLTDLKIDKGVEFGQYSYSYSTDVDDDAIKNDLKTAIELFISTTVIRYDVDEQHKVISDSSLDYYKTLDNSLPYSVKRIFVKKYLEIEDADIDYLPVDCKWIFITGENGYGKTTFLQAIAIALHGTIDDGVSLSEDDCFIGIEFKSNNDNIINNVGNRFFKEFDYLLCYGPSRLQIQPRMSQNDITKQSTTTYNLFNSDGVLLNIESSLVIWYLDNKKRFEDVKKIFKKVIPTLSDIIVEKNKEGDYDISYIEQEENNFSKTYAPVPFRKLASGLRNIMAMVGDILIRLIRKHQSVVDLSELSGIVLIDELENHLHPKWQYKLPSLLSEVFPKIQFIVTTHSVIPVLGSPPASQFLKLVRQDNRITINKLDIDISNLLPNSILTSPIFDMNTIFPVSNENISNIRTEDSYQEVFDNDVINEGLKAFDKENKNLPDSLFD